ncbi:hypothetical protein A8L45_09210 [Veronia pacifica]|uniref:Uncharacterized protein n=2 Tax=Veronia pacifica TaxID=1080227 RepID=A0A1C3EKN5_9GAMM|nr:hypothetical protein A8L45_09210 [Veronia pacifica]
MATSHSRTSRIEEIRKPKGNSQSAALPASPRQTDVGDNYGEHQVHHLEPVPAVHDVGSEGDSESAAPPTVESRQNEEAHKGSFYNPYKFGQDVSSGVQAPLVSEENQVVYATDGKSMYMLDYNNRVYDDTGNSWTNPWVIVPEPAQKTSAKSTAVPSSLVVSTPTSPPPIAGGQPTTGTQPAPRATPDVSNEQNVQSAEGEPQTYDNTLNTDGPKLQPVPAVPDVEPMDNSESAAPPASPRQTDVGNNYGEHQVHHLEPVPAVPDIGPKGDSESAAPPRVESRQNEEAHKGSFDNPYKFGQGVLSGVHEPIVSEENKVAFATDGKSMYQLHYNGRAYDDTGNSWTNPWVIVPEPAQQPSAESTAVSGNPVGSTPTSPALVAGGQPTTETQPAPRATSDVSNEQNMQSAGGEPQSFENSEVSKVVQNFNAEVQSLKEQMSSLENQYSSLQNQYLSLEKQALDSLKQIYNDGSFPPAEKKQISSAVLETAWIRYRQDNMEPDGTVNIDVEGKEILQRWQNLEDKYEVAENDVTRGYIKRQFTDLIDGTAGNLPKQVEDLTDIYLEQALLEYLRTASNALQQQNADN